jgi:hypothetical protein
MPHDTCVAMHDAVQRNPIIVGAYVDRDGGMCPMLAAHRNGGRTTFESFAKAWDRYTHATTPRRATEREIRTLVKMLEESIAAEEARFSGNLSDAIADHRNMQLQRARREEGQPGRDWRRPFNRRAEYAAAFAELDAKQSEAVPEREEELV